MGEDYDPWLGLAEDIRGFGLENWDVPAPGFRVVYFHLQGVPDPNELGALQANMDPTQVDVATVDFDAIPATATRIGIGVPLSLSVHDAYEKAWAHLQSVLPSAMDLNLDDEGIKIGIVE